MSLIKPRLDTSENDEALTGVGNVHPRYGVHQMQMRVGFP
jgi:hypothetical protein